MAEIVTANEGSVVPSARELETAWNKLADFIHLLGRAFNTVETIRLPLDGSHGSSSLYSDLIKSLHVPDDLALRVLSSSLMGETAARVIDPRQREDTEGSVWDQNPFYASQINTRLRSGFARFTDVDKLPSPYLSVIDFIEVPTEGNPHRRTLRISDELTRLEDLRDSVLVSAVPRIDLAPHLRA